MPSLFRLYRLRFHFVSEDRVFYPRGKASNVIRGALGTILRQLACVPECDSARSCELRKACAYARIFEPSGWDEGPSGLQDPPRPFVLRAAHLDGWTVAPGGAFFFDLHLFLITEPPLQYFVLAFRRLAETGLGPGRGRVRLEAVDLIGKDPLADRKSRIFAEGRFAGSDLPPPLEFPLTGRGDAKETLMVRFVTPMELKQNGQIALRPEFGLIVTRMAERISNLCAMYGEGPPQWDWRGMVARANSVQLIEWKVRKLEAATRVSTKTGQKHGVGGFLGEAVYSGCEMGEFLPLFEAAKYCGIGRHTVWGNGVLEVER